MAGLDDWLSVARADRLDDVRERILTGYLSGKPFTPYVPTIALPRPLTRVLDFGCGLGRNFPYLQTIATTIVGFDLPPMIERCRPLIDPRVQLTADWTEIAGGRYDLIFATLVLQHIEPDACRSYLADFARLAPAIYLLTRHRSDFGDNMFDLIGRTQLFEAGPCVDVEHDPDTHQLRVLGETTFETLRGAADGGHYEVVLRVASRSRGASAPR